MPCGSAVHEHHEEKHLFFSTLPISNFSRPMLQPSRRAPLPDCSPGFGWSSSHSWGGGAEGTGGLSHQSDRPEVARQAWLDEVRVWEREVTLDAPGGAP